MLIGHCWWFIVVGLLSLGYYQWATAYCLNITHNTLFVSFNDGLIAPCFSHTMIGSVYTAYNMQSSPVKWHITFFADLHKVQLLCSSCSCPSKWGWVGDTPSFLARITYVFLWVHTKNDKLGFQGWDLKYLLKSPTLDLLAVHTKNGKSRLLESLKNGVFVFWGGFTLAWFLRGTYQK